jgi:predicted hydrocarbon binding protein
MGNENLLDNMSQVDRPELGDTIPIPVFRIFRQFSALYAEDTLGEKGTKIVFQRAGQAFGQKIGESLHSEDLDQYLANVTKFVKDAGIGILSVSEFDSSKMVFRLDECITCAGMSNIGRKICYFETGFVQGVVQSFLPESGKSIWAHETKCNANGDDCCEVTIDLDKDAAVAGLFQSKNNES